MSTGINEIGEQLRAKIAGKFQITSILAGFSFTTISIQLTFLFQPMTPHFLPHSFAGMFSSLVLYCWGLYRLDGLTMPKRFWTKADIQNIPAPPGDVSWDLTDDNLWALKNRMVFYWMRFTIVAVVLTVLALLLMMAPDAPRPTDGTNAVSRSFFWTCGGIVFGFLYCGVWYVVERWKEKNKKFGTLLRFVD